MGVNKVNKDDILKIENNYYKIKIVNRKSHYGDSNIKTIYLSKLNSYEETMLLPLCELKKIKNAIQGKGVKQ